MKKYIFLTSAITLCTLCPAMAENFPGDGNMLENKTYDNAATYANTGIYEGTVVANADYSLNPYSVSAGSYFTGIDNSTNQATTATCTSGNYCPGVASTTYDNNAFGDTGLQTCPQNYSGSATGATANTDCYRACATTDITHSTAITGNVYYNGTDGDGTKVCTPTSCDNGWHPKAAAPDLTTLIGNTSNITAVAYRANNGDTGYNSSAETQSAYGVTNGEFVVDYGDKGKLHGHAKCSTQVGEKGTLSNGMYPNVSTFESLPDNSGEYCYCKLDDYTSADGIQQSLLVPWVFAIRYTSVNCSGPCTGTCAKFFYSNSSEQMRAMRATVFGLVPGGPASCEANTINITWNDASAEDIAATGAATTVYEGDIKTPLKAVTKPGKTFVGWKFVKPQQSSGGGMNPGQDINPGDEVEFD